MTARGSTRRWASARRGWTGEGAAGDEAVRLGTVVTGLWRRKRLVAATFALLAGIWSAATLGREDVYRSEAKLLIQVGRESVTLDPTVTMGQVVDFRQSRENELRSELEILRSRDLAERTVRVVGPAAILDPASFEVVRADASEGELDGRLRRAAAAVARLVERVVPPVEMSDDQRAALAVMEAVELELLADSSVIRLAFESSNRRLAQRVVAAYVEGFLAKHNAVHQNPGSLEFFREQVEELRLELADAEERLRDFRDATGVASIEPHRAMLLERLSAIEQEDAALQRRHASTSAKIRALERSLVDMPETILLQRTTGSTTAVADGLTQQINALELELQGLEVNYQQDSRRVRVLETQLKAARELLAKSTARGIHTTEGINSAREQVKLALVDEEAGLASIEASLETAKAHRRAVLDELAGLNDDEVEMARLLRDVRLREANYLEISDNLEQARVRSALALEDISNIRVIQEATLPLRPIGVGKGFALAVGALLCLSAALALAFLVESLDRSIRTPEDASRLLGLSALACVPSQSRRRRERPERAPLDGVATLRDRVLFAPEGTPAVIAVTSARPGEGVSTISVQLAAALAWSADGDVLLAEASAEEPSAPRRLEAASDPEEKKSSAGPAPTAAPAGDREHVQARKLPNLRVTAGDLDLSRLPGTRELEALLGRWKETYRFVVVELPAIQETPGAARLAALCDAAVLVVEAGGLPWPAVESARAELDDHGANVLGVVLNRTRSTRSSSAA